VIGAGVLRAHEPIHGFPQMPLDVGVSWRAMVEVTPPDPVCVKKGFFLERTKQSDQSAITP